MKDKENGLKRYNLVLPQELWNELQAVADREHVPAVELLRKYVKLGLLVSNSPDDLLILKNGEIERQIVML